MVLEDLTQFYFFFGCLLVLEVHSYRGNDRLFGNAFELGVFLGVEEVFHVEVCLLEDGPLKTQIVTCWLLQVLRLLVFALLDLLDVQVFVERRLFFYDHLLELLRRILAV